MSNASSKDRPHPTIFVLWGTHFDEVAAVLVITGLRRLGLRVKVIGLSAPCTKGAHGLGLQADWTLDEALAAADQAIGVMIPCTMPTFQGVWVDPRVQALVEQVNEGQELFVIQIDSLSYTLLLYQKLSASKV